MEFDRDPDERRKGERGVKLLMDELSSVRRTVGLPFFEADQGAVNVLDFFGGRRPAYLVEKDQNTTGFIHIPSSESKTLGSDAGEGDLR
jgi:hypothetical protein